MNNHIFATVIFGLAASLCWGSGDFSGGLASRRAYAGSVVLTDYAVGLVLLVTLAGVLDAIGSALFVLAAHSGRLDIAAIVSSLYPAATVGLAALVLRERVIHIQAIGILLLLLAIPLISA
jgi:uncharacterized membrane protein